MNTPKYLYIDDENGPSEDSTLHGFNDLKFISVERFPLSQFKEFGKLKLELVKRFNAGNFAGLILDLRLDGSGEDRTEFNATSLAQELRSVSARNEISAFPIVLCSTEEKIRATYMSDKTSHDLFDYKISKSNANPNWVKLSEKLKSLAEGYNWLRQEKRDLHQTLGIDPQLVDPRIIEKINTFTTNYDYAYFIVKEFFHQTNPLINEKILAARLGISLEKTPAESWKGLLNGYFANSLYTGLFSGGWRRWWSDMVIDLFSKMSDGAKLSFLKAHERVEILKNKSGISNLVAAEPIKFCNSTEYWTICEGFKTPIDPLEAFKISTNADLKPWQESKYVSLFAILEREGYTDRGLRPHPSEDEKISYTMELLGL